MIQLALQEGLKDSITHKNQDSDELQGQIRVMDVDGNHKLSVSEVQIQVHMYIICIKSSE